MKQTREKQDAQLRQNLHRVQLEGYTLERERKAVEEAASERQENARQQQELAAHVKKPNHGSITDDFLCAFR